MSDSVAGIKWVVSNALLCFLAKEIQQSCGLQGLLVAPNVTLTQPATSNLTFYDVAPASSTIAITLLAVDGDPVLSAVEILPPGAALTLDVAAAAPPTADAASTGVNTKYLVVGAPHSWPLLCLQADKHVRISITQRGT